MLFDLEVSGCHACGLWVLTKPSSGIRQKVSCFGLRLMVPRGAGRPLEVRQLMSGSLSRFYNAAKTHNGHQTTASMRMELLAWGPASATYDAFLGVSLVGLLDSEALLVPVLCDTQEAKTVRNQSS